jgi:hypothetical protein
MRPKVEFDAVVAVADSVDRPRRHEREGYDAFFS